MARPTFDELRRRLEAVEREARERRYRRCVIGDCSERARVGKPYCHAHTPPKRYCKGITKSGRACMQPVAGANEYCPTHWCQKDSEALKENAE